MTELNAIKQHILARSIDDDQKAIATQWLMTFMYNDPNDAAIKLSQLLFACLREGDFKTKSVNANQFTAPNDVLTLVDYLSHASRIIIDYQQLSPIFRNELLAFFPHVNEQGVIARSSTHAVIRNSHGIKELKGFHLGLKGQLRTNHQARDFGIDIAMGGEGKTNYIRQRIAKNGYSGHLFFHRNDEDALLMVGLEQSAPAKSILSLLDLFSISEQEEIQHHTDQFGQGHSLVGASDTYTAAGSLYFSDAVYQAKLLVEKHAMPPQKYGGMQVVIHDNNWPHIKQFLYELLANIKPEDPNALFEQLLMKPKDTIQDESQLTYIALDFKAYLHQCLSVFVPEENSELNAQQQDLLTHIESMQLCNDPIIYIQLHEHLIAKIHALVETAEHSLIDKQNYIDAILRLQTLFINQLNCSHGLTEAQKALLLEEQISDAMKTLDDLLKHLEMLQDHFHFNPSPFFTKDNQIELSKFIDMLKHGQHCVDDEDPHYSIVMNATEQLTQYQQLIDQSKTLVERLIASQEIQHLRAAQDENTAKLHTLQEEITLLCRQKEWLEQQLADAIISEPAETPLVRALQQEVHELRQAQAAQENIIEAQYIPRAQLRTFIPPKPLLSGVSFQIIGAFCIALGITAVALAVAALIIGTGISATLLVGGALSCFAGGLFYHQGTEQKKCELAMTALETMAL